MRKLRAFVLRDYRIATSYRAAFAFRLLSTLLWVPLCYTLGLGLPAIGESEGIERYGTDAFAFLLIGVGLLGYFTISLQTFHRSVRDSQLMGTLEIVLLSPTSVTELLLYSSAWTYLFTTLRFLLCLVCGVFFGLDLGNANAPAALVVLLLAIPAFAAFGVVSATVVLLIKRGEAVNVLLVSGSLVLGGVVVPVEELPGWLRPVADLLPITHALEGMRLAIFQGASVAELAAPLGALAAFACLALPVAVLGFQRAVRATKTSGSLAHY